MSVIPKEAIEAARAAGACGAAMEWLDAAPRTYAQLWEENKEWALCSFRIPECREALVASAPADVRVIASGEAKIAEGCAVAYGSAVVYADDSAVVYAYDSAVVNAYDSAVVNAYNSAVVNAYNSAVVNAYDSARVRAYDSEVVFACGEAKVGRILASGGGK